MGGLSDLVALRIITRKANDILKQPASRGMTMISFHDNGRETLFEYSPSYMDERMLARLGLGLDNEGHIGRYTLSSMPHQVRQLRSSLQDDLSIMIKRVLCFTRLSFRIGLRLACDSR